MPSWSITSLLPFTRSSKHTSTSSSTSSSSSSPLGTPSGSIIWTAGTSPTPETGGRLRRRKQRQRQQHQPKPVQPRLSSLFFPTTQLTPEQEVRCSYRASFAASCSDLSYLQHTEARQVSDSNSPFGNYGRQQANYTSLDLTTASIASPPSYPSHVSFARSVGNLHGGLPLLPENDPYSTIAPLGGSAHRVSRKSVDYSAMSRKERSLSTSGPAGKVSIERGTEIWSSPFDSFTDLSASLMPPPPVPARSSLRPTASANNLRDRFSRQAISGSITSFSPDALTRPSFSPSMSSGSQASFERDMSSSASRSPVTPSASSESAFSLGRKKRQTSRGGSISGDPNRIKDGATSRESASGVYTPTSFAGPQGQQNVRPVASQSKVYTPANFAASSPRTFVPPPPSPSRSTSVSSTSTTSSAGEVTTPRTPHTPGNRFLAAVSGGWGNAVSGIKRASATLSTRSLSSPSSSAGVSYTPTSAREGYFSSTIYEGITTASPAGTPLAPSLYPTSTTSTTESKPYGLGLGLGAEDAAYHRGRSETATSEKYGGALVGDVPKGKRKPMPRPAVAGQEGIREEEEEQQVGCAM